MGPPSKFIYAVHFKRTLASVGKPRKRRVKKRSYKKSVHQTQDSSYNSSSVQHSLTTVSSQGVVKTKASRSFEIYHRQKKPTWLDNFMTKQLDEQKALSSSTKGLAVPQDTNGNQPKLSDA